MNRTSTRSAADRKASSIVDHLPVLPPMVRYYDDFDEKQRSIRDFQEASSFVVYVDGRAESPSLL